ncbi:CBS domain-containing protein|uniref:Acetoin utilization protein AcuB n=1 Tax=Dendrosporobacter quercicolus TaxID=146817 RepID=A0A1G9XY34_9FIRM|nr:CBS domain-containing protein [Dendrosporobacter quercicolus]NSL49045.1 CBS domain-containing protein [Dendrosporobacter quercicolus DSM 1736]SDN01689.1 acetoin utilization protein AcuB [Dendrosporobacter quercicolus]
MFVASRMTPDPVTITPATTVADASELMRTHKFRRLPVVADKKIVGIVTDRDLMEVSPSPATTLSIFELNYLLAKMQVKDIMTKNVVTIGVGATVEEAALVMYNNRIGGLPVVDDSGQVAGLITETDIFKCFVDIMGLPGGKTRLTIDVTDKVGVISDIAAVFTVLDVNIGSMATYTLPDGRYELVIRTDAADLDELLKRLAAKGYPVSHVVKIGS